MRSSYRQNNYGALLTHFVHVTKPKNIVECGILDGYSLFHMATGADSYDANIFAYDLFDDYEFKHGNKEEIEKSLWYFKNKPTLAKCDAIAAAKNHEDDSVDLLHIDIANDGQKLTDMFYVWAPKIKLGGYVLFEGGSKERDQVEWMVKYEKLPIYPFVQALPAWGFDAVTLDAFPSMTICKKNEERTWWKIK